MSAMRDEQSSSKNASFVSSRVLIGGISSVGVVMLSAVGITASNSLKTSEVSNFSQSRTGAESNITIETALPVDTTEPLTPVEESFTQSSDGNSSTKQYRTTTTDQNGNQTTQERTYTTTIDGGSAVDINVNSNITSTGSSNSNSSVKLNVSSSSKVSSSGQQ